jgi:DNA-binding MltR family transcriptional regulator
MTRRKPFPAETLSEDSQRLLDVLNNEADLPAVLVASSYLDECLASLLHRFFVESKTADSLLSPVSGPIGTYAARADLAYVLGLVNEYAFRDLKTIGTIRNAFAHSHLAVTFADQAVTDLALQLDYLSVLDTEMNINDGRGAVFLSRVASAPRERFVFTVVMLANQLLLLALGAKRQQRSDAFVQSVAKAQRANALES